MGGRSSPARARRATQSSSALRQAERRLRTLRRVIGASFVDEAAVAAVDAARKRIERRIETRGPVSEERGSGGFRAYCRVVLFNEIRRQMAQRARANSGPLKPGVAETFDLWSALRPLPATKSIGPNLRVPDSFVPSPDQIVCIKLRVRAWAYRYHLRTVAKFESRFKTPCLVMEAGGTRVVEVKGIGKDRLRDQAQEIDIPAAFKGQVRVENLSPAPLHLEIFAVAYGPPEGGFVHFRRPLRVFDSQRGYGRLMRPAWRSVGDGPRWRHWDSTDDATGSDEPRGRPRVLPVAKDFELCRIRAALLQTVGALGARELEAAARAEDRSTRDDAATRWLTSERVWEISAATWWTGLAQRQPEDRARLICALAEWANRGTHDPRKRGANPGGFPLAGELKCETRRAHDAYCSACSPNAAAQARSRMRARVRKVFQVAAPVIHTRITRAEHSRSVSF